LSTDRLIRWNVTVIGRCRSTSTSQRDVSQAKGQIGSTQMWTGVSDCDGAVRSCITVDGTPHFGI
jgi:hypothetical protein